MYIVYETNWWDCGYDDYPVLKNSLLDAVKLVKNADFDNHKYSGYGIRFDRHETFSVAKRFGKVVIIFEVDMRSSVHFDIKKKDILNFVEGPTQGSDDATLTAKKT